MELEPEDKFFFLSLPAFSSALSSRPVKISALFGPMIADPVSNETTGRYICSASEKIMKGIPKGYIFLSTAILVSGESWIPNAPTG